MGSDPKTLAVNVAEVPLALDLNLFFCDSEFPRIPFDLPLNSLPLLAQLYVLSGLFFFTLLSRARHIEMVPWHMCQNQKSTVNRHLETYWPVGTLMQVEIHQGPRSESIMHFRSPALGSKAP